MIRASPFTGERDRVRGFLLRFGRTSRVRSNGCCPGSTGEPCRTPRTTATGPRPDCRRRTRESCDRRADQFGAADQGYGAGGLRGRPLRDAIRKGAQNPDHHPCRIVCSNGNNLAGPRASERGRERRAPLILSRHPRNSAAGRKLHIQPLKKHQEVPQEQRLVRAAGEMRIGDAANGWDIDDLGDIAPLMDRQ